MSITIPIDTKLRRSNLIEAALLECDPLLKDRPYQIKAIVAILEEEQSRCLVKMFCGTGKSRILYHTLRCCIDAATTTSANRPDGGGLGICVFPSLALVRQFSQDYLEKLSSETGFEDYVRINVSSETLPDIQSTTNSSEIQRFLTNNSRRKRVILVTYQSLVVLYEALEKTEQTVNIACYDEAHHIVGEKCQALIFPPGQEEEDEEDEDYDCNDEDDESNDSEDEEDYDASFSAEEPEENEKEKCRRLKRKFQKRVFFTATPKNANGLVMMDYDDEGLTLDCGPVVFDYSYFAGLRDGYLNNFEISIDLFTEETNVCLYESIARAILTTGNSRVLTFHAGVREDGAKSNVLNFVDKQKFKAAFRRIVEKEFPDKKEYYTKITFKGLDGSSGAKKRERVLSRLDSTSDTEIYMLSSCDTIGEGVDTRRANLCVFVDPRTSHTKIIQNIGRIVRKPEGTVRPATILIPCHVHAEQYRALGGDRTQIDLLIRSQLRLAGGGDFASILNVLAALRCEDPALFESVLNYPVIKKKQELVDKGRADTRRLARSEEDVQNLRVENGNKRVEVYSLENDEVVIHNEEGGGVGDDKISLLHDPVGRVYYEMEKSDAVELETIIKESPVPKKRLPIRIHTNEDLKVLWSLKDFENCDWTKTLQNRILECTIESKNTMLERLVEKLKELTAFLQLTQRRPKRITNKEIKEEKDESKRKAMKEEQNLAHWIGTSQNNYKKHRHNMADAACRVKWEELLKSELGQLYLLDRDELFDSNLTKLNAFLQLTQRRPKEFKNKEIEEEIDESKRKVMREEQKLAVWIGTSRNNYKKHQKNMADEACRVKWEELLKSELGQLLIVLDSDELLDSNLTKLTAFLQLTQRRPKNIRNKEIKEEKDESKRKAMKAEQKLATWIGKSQKNYKKHRHNMADSACRVKWEELLKSELGQLLIVLDSDELLDSNLTKLNAFLQLTQRRPKNIRNKEIEEEIDESKRKVMREEQKLAAWIGTSQENYKKHQKNMADEACRVKWEELLKSELGQLLIVLDTDELFDSNLTKLNAFLQLTQRRPKEFKKKVIEEEIDESKRKAMREEQKLAVWIGNSQKNYKKHRHNMADSACRVKWEELLKSELGQLLIVLDSDELFDSNLTKLNAFLQLTQRRPKNIRNKEIEEEIDESKRKAMKEEQKLATWISASKENYKKHQKNMADEACRVKWEELLKSELGLLITCKSRSNTELNGEEMEVEMVDEEIVEEEKNAKKRKAAPSPQKIEKVAKKAKIIKAKTVTTKKQEEKTFDTMSEQEKRVIIEKECRRRKEVLGYRSTNPDEKDQLNSIFSQQISNCGDIGDLVVVLDHTEFKTAYALLERGLLPEQIVIPQYDEAVYLVMRQHPLLGSCVVLKTLQVVLDELILNRKVVAGVYADLTGPIRLGREILSQIVKLKLRSEAVVGITITLRNPEGTSFQYADVSKLVGAMNRELFTVFQTYPLNLFSADDNEALVYGGGAMMATCMLKLPAPPPLFLST